MPLDSSLSLIPHINLYYFLLRLAYITTNLVNNKFVILQFCRFEVWHWSLAEDLLRLDKTAFLSGGSRGENVSLFFPASWDCPLPWRVAPSSFRVCAGLHWGAGSRAVAHRLSCPSACGSLVFEPEIKSSSPHWKVASQPLDHQGSPLSLSP